MKPEPFRSLLRRPTVPGTQLVAFPSRSRSFPIVRDNPIAKTILMMALRPRYARTSSRHTFYLSQAHGRFLRRQPLVSFPRPESPLRHPDQPRCVPATRLRNANLEVFSPNDNSAYLAPHSPKPRPVPKLDSEIPLNRAAPHPFPELFSLLS
jgi:hypothetical protein